jgi:hypothetical protein
MHRTIRRPTDTTPTRTGWRSLVLAALCCTLTACTGGSGSSGFDPLKAENAAIDRAITSQGCEVAGGLTICASGGEAPSPTVATTATPTATTRPSPPHTATLRPTLALTASPTGTPGPLGSPTATTTPPPLPTATGTPPPPPSPTPTATPVPLTPRVATNLDGSESIPCTQSGPQAPCTFVLVFQPQAVPADAAYRVAVRARDPDGTWLVLPVTDHSAVIPVEPGRQYQIAVLLFLGEPGALPDEVELLADTGADIAFVTPVLQAVQLVPARP